ncbi:MULTISPECIES: hypothetical protein [Rhodococcus]|uniref:hypothetical protein n=1 Tax=Rhodococcus TaxID=1827 RepID=UPI0002F1D875|nr:MULTISPECIES: hypothetical protein [Rhodococcus]MDV7357676.1 hypothetical protein [Rhodococcus oxybenzonivorans]
MTVQIVLHDGTSKEYVDRKDGRGETLDREDFWYNVNENGVLRVWRRHLDGATWKEGVSDFTETSGVVITYGPAGWVSVEGEKTDPRHS